MSAAVVDTKRVCSHCLRGQHSACTVPDTCGCPTCNPVLPALPDGMAWESPPPAAPGRGGVLTPEVEQVLRDCPGEWLRLRVYKSASGAKAAATALRTGKWPGIDPKEWEVEGRTVKPGSVLYVRFVGKGGSRP